MGAGRARPWQPTGRGPCSPPGAVLGPRRARALQPAGRGPCSLPGAVLAARRVRSLQPAGRGPCSLQAAALAARLPPSQDGGQGQKDEWFRRVGQRIWRVFPLLSELEIMSRTVRAKLKQRLRLKSPEALMLIEMTAKTGHQRRPLHYNYLALCVYWLIEV
jgi:hypothetical protein